MPPASARGGHQAHVLGADDRLEGLRHSSMNSALRLF
jgi:hypothetical protein